MEQGFLSKQEPAKQGKPQAGMQDADMKAMSDNIKSNVPKEYQEAYTRVVVAGMELLFGEKSNNLIEKGLESEGELAQKFGEGVSAILALIMKQAKGAVPGEVVIPAGIELCIQVAKYLNDSGQADIDMATFGRALEVMIYDTMQRNGAGPQQFDGYLDAQAQKAHGQPQGQPPQGQPQQPQGAA